MDKLKKVVRREKDEKTEEDGILEVIVDVIFFNSPNLQIKLNFT